MKYRKVKWKYLLPNDENFQTLIFPGKLIETDYIRLDEFGTLTLKKGYAWDGASGPAFDTPSFMRASAVHDALYQLMKLDLLSKCFFEVANKEMVRWAARDGMWKIRQQWCYWAVQNYGRQYMTRDEDDMKVYEAP